LVFLSIWFGKIETKESLITLVIQSLLFFADSIFYSIWFCISTNRFFIIQDGCWCLYDGFYLWVILPVLASFDLFGFLDGCFVVVSYNCSSFFALGAASFSLLLVMDFSGGDTWFTRCCPLFGCSCLWCCAFAIHDSLLIGVLLENLLYLVAVPFLVVAVEAVDVAF